MLKIDRVEIQGFKSFCDRTEVRLQQGITAVVGPNGCGKSNIGDAIHWALGEQSARTLRGGRMEDVIFAGTEARGPHGMAEVSIHLKSSNGHLPEGQGQATITRRLFRSGDGEYLINGRKSRLRDIQELLQAAHVGATAYAVIEQGKVDAILSAKPRERRHLIEEAAGITGYKQKRHLAELKLLATEANLQRIHDVILEVRRQINSLKRQAARARRYTRVRDEMRGLEARIFAARARDCEAQAAEARRALACAQEREAEAATALGRIEAEIETRREARREIEAGIASARDELHRLSREIDHEESAIRSETERAAESRREAERLVAEGVETGARLDAARGEKAGREDALAALDAELAQIERELEEVAAREAELRSRGDALAAAIESRRSEQVGGASRLAELGNTIGHLERELQRLEGQAARLAGEREQAERAAAEALARADEARAEGAAAASSRETAGALAGQSRATVRELEETVRRIGDAIAQGREDLARLDERVRSLEDVEARFAGLGAGARWLLTRNGAGAVRGVVADFLRTGPEAETALEGYLGPLLAAVVVPSSESAASLVGDLNESRAGRCVFVPEEIHAGSAEQSLPGELAAEPGVLGALSKLASTTNGIGGILARRLSGAVLVKDLAAAIELSRRYPGRDFVTPSGEVVGRDGVIEGGRGAGTEDGLLARRRLLETTRHEREEATAALSAAEESRRGAESAREAAAAELASRERALQAAERDEAIARERAETLASDREREARRLELLVQEIATLEDERRGAGERLEATVSEKGALEMELALFAEGIEEQKLALDGLRAEAAGASERLADRRLVRAAVRERRNHTAGEVERLQGEIAGLEERIDRGRARREELEARAGAADEAVEAARTRLAGLVAAHAGAGESLAGGEERLREADAGAAALEEEGRQRRAALEQAREGRGSAEMAAAVADSEMRHLDERCRTALDEDLGALLARVPEEPEIDLPTLEGECAHHRAALDSMGPVNLLAIQEFRELEERYEFFLAQEKDLTGSMESLRETIRRINRTSRERFLEAFDRIRSYYSETFRLLFGGGRADIRLMEDEDPLECGLEIIVQPPGKNLQSLSLLSGGEKALSAIALLFAIFRYQPSPFCLLDEVDAALDESNVRRFTRLLREFAGETQFVVITHNKRSMEIADTLYGVTMEEPGISRLVSMTLTNGRPVRVS